METNQDVRDNIMNLFVKKSQQYDLWRNYQIQIEGPIIERSKKEQTKYEYLDLKPILLSELEQEKL